MSGRAQHHLEQAYEAVGELDRRLDAIHGLHQPDSPHAPICRECMVGYPCPTARLVNGPPPADPVEETFG